MDPVRQPTVAGRFYPGEARQLSDDVARYLSAGSGTRAEAARAIVTPHAGYIYSGGIAGRTYVRVAVPKRVVLICPNHTGLGAARSLWARGVWRLPSGDVEVDSELCERVGEYAGLRNDERAHLREHAIEVHLPFLQALQPSLRIVPICLARLKLAECLSIGTGLARAIRETNQDVLVVASTDMSHYVPADVARKWDMCALDRVLAMDPDGLYSVVTRHDISMCGFIPTTVALAVAVELGATRAELVAYGNSGETSGDYERVVGYAGVIIT
jgi:hypothetical protein